MDTFYWNENFITGLPEVDQQHKKLVDIINQLGEKVAEGVTTLEEVEPIFKELTDYSAYHFQCEEDFMAFEKLCQNANPISRSLNFGINYFLNTIPFAISYSIITPYIKTILIRNKYGF